jgi:hypothetical protein
MSRSSVQHPNLLRQALMLGLMTFTPAAISAAGQMDTRPCDDSAADKPLVKLIDDRLSVHVCNATWSTVAELISANTHVHVHVNNSQQTQHTHSFSNLPFALAMERLFGPRANLIYQYPPGQEVTPTTVPVNVWVLDNQHIIPAAPAEQIGLIESDSSSLAKWLEMTRSADPSVRAQGLKEIFASRVADSVTLHRAIKSALGDPESTVRLTAVDLVAAMGDPGMTDYIKWALNDADASVVSAASRFISSLDDSENLPLEASSDENYAAISSDDTQISDDNGESDQ